MSGFRRYKRTNIAEMRLYVPGEDLSKISVSSQDDPETDRGMVARNPANHDDQWYVARKYFEDNFSSLHAPRESMSFGQAIECLKDGRKVARRGWNGKGMWLALQPGSKISSDQARGGAAKHRADELASPDHPPESVDGIEILPHIDMRAADGSIVVGWLASQTDMLSEDWCIVE